MTKLKEQSWTGTFPASKQLMGTIPGRMVALFKLVGDTDGDEHFVFHGIYCKILKKSKFAREM